MARCYARMARNRAAVAWLVGFMTAASTHMVVRLGQDDALTLHEAGRVPVRKLVSNNLHTHPTSIL